jgi:hypothetical protein
MGSSTIILKEYYICIKFNCNIPERIFLDFLIDFFADFTHVLFIDMVAMMVGRAGSSDIPFKGNPLRMIQAKWFQRRRFLKKFTDGRRMPSDDNSSHR